MIVTESQTCCTSARMCELSSTVTPLAPSSRIMVADLADAGRVEPVGRLVEDQQLGLLQQRRGDREPLLHAERVALVAVRRRGRSGPTVSSARSTRVAAAPMVRASRVRFWRPVKSGANFGLPRRRRRPGPSPRGSRPGRRLAEQPHRARRRRGPGRAASGSWWSCRTRWGRGSRARRRAAPRRSRSSTATRTPPRRVRNSLRRPCGLDDQVAHPAIARSPSATTRAAARRSADGLTTGTRSSMRAVLAGLGPGVVVGGRLVGRPAEVVVEVPADDGRDLGDRDVAAELAAEAW